MSIAQRHPTSKGIGSGNKITISSPVQPRFDDIYRETLTLLVRTHEVMERVIPQARELFEERGKSPDIYLFNDLVRYYARELLDKSGFALEDDGEDVTEYKFRALLNNGLSGTFNGRRFRILKSDHGSVPMPASRAKREFYTQPPQLRLQLEPSVTVRHNILILWEVDDQYNFLRLRLACPKSVGVTRASLEVYFNEPLPHAAEMIVSRHTAIGTSERSEGIQVTRRESECMRARTP